MPLVPVLMGILMKPILAHKVLKMLQKYNADETMMSEVCIDTEDQFIALLFRVSKLTNWLLHCFML